MNRNTLDPPASASWITASTFVAACYITTWLTWAACRPGVVEGQSSAFWTFLFVTVWSPTVVALVLSVWFGGRPAVAILLGRLFRRPSPPKIWYVAAIILPALCLFAATLLARALHQGARLIPMAALIPTVAIQLGTGAVGEELGWRGFLLPILQCKFSPLISALIMSVLWAFWHLPAFFLPGMPQTMISPLAFFTSVIAFGIFLSLLFNRTQWHVFATMLAHFVFNTSLALGGARLGNTWWWGIAATTSLLACWSAFLLSKTSVAIPST